MSLTSTSHLPADLNLIKHRLARHYLGKLRTADEALRHGQAAISYGTTVFNQEWEQIRHWQAWAVEHQTEDEICAALCKDFVLAGLEVLANRNNFADHVLWLTNALKVAQQSHDQETARTVLYHLSYTNQRLGNLEQAQEYANQLLTIASHAGDWLSVGHAYDELGSIAEERGQYPEAHTNYQRAVEIFAQMDRDTATAHALHGLGAVALYRGNYHEASLYFRRQLALVEAQGSRAEVCDALLSVAEAAETYIEAEPFIQRALDLAETLSFPRLKAAASISMANWKVELGHFEQACPYFEQGIEAARKIGSQRNVIHGLSSLGYALMRMGDYDAALTHLRESLQLAREMQLPRYICNVQRNIANTHLALNDLDAARQALQDSMTFAQALNSHAQKARNISVAVAYYLRSGQSQQAAVWAGSVVDDPNLDQPLFQPVCLELETALGHDTYHAAIAHGKTWSVDAVLDAILNDFQHSGV